MEPGIISKVIGGIGNQMFQAAAGFAASKKYNCPLYLTKYTYQNHHKNIVNYFETVFKHLGNPIEQEDYDKCIQNFFPYGINNFNNHAWEFYMPSTHEYSTDNLTIPILFNQYFQYYPPIEPYEFELRSIFTNGLIHHIETIKMEYESKVELDKSVFLHIRRGDYVGLQHIHPLTTMSYYENAIKIVEETSSNIIIFSDDIEWAKQQTLFSSNPKVFFIDNKDEVYTLAFMSLCKKGAICANSTFSWWGAFLGAYEKRNPVYVPRNWILNSRIDALFPKEWIVLDC